MAAPNGYTAFFKKRFRDVAEDMTNAMPSQALAKQFGLEWSGLAEEEKEEYRRQQQQQKEDVQPETD